MCDKICEPAQHRRKVEEISKDRKELEYFLKIVGARKNQQPLAGRFLAQAKKNNPRRRRCKNA